MQLIDSVQNKIYATDGFSSRERDIEVENSKRTLITSSKIHPKPAR